MKKLTLVLVLGLGLVSCNKEEITPNKQTEVSRELEKNFAYLGGTWAISEVSQVGISNLDYLNIGGGYFQDTIDFASNPTEITIDHFGGGTGHYKVVTYTSGGAGIINILAFNNLVTVSNNMSETVYTLDIILNNGDIKELTVEVLHNNSNPSDDIITIGATEDIDSWGSEAYSWSLVRGIRVFN